MVNLLAAAVGMDLSPLGKCHSELEAVRPCRGFGAGLAAAASSIKENGELVKLEQAEAARKALSEREQTVTAGLEIEP